MQISQVGSGNSGRTEQAQTEEAVFRAVTVLAVVYQREAVIRAVDIYVFMRAYLELRPVHAVFLFRRAVEGAELDIAVDFVREECGDKVRSQHLEAFVPVYRRVESYHIVVYGKGYFLYERGFVVFESLFSYDFRAVDIRANADEFHVPFLHVGIVDIYIPRVVVHERVAVYRELVEILAYDLLAAFFVVKRGYFSVGAEHYAYARVLERIVV